MRIHELNMNGAYRFHARNWHLGEDFAQRELCIVRLIFDANREARGP